jgi:hypothetical protein
MYNLCYSHRLWTFYCPDDYQSQPVLFWPEDSLAFYPVSRKRKKRVTVRDYKFDLGGQPKKSETSPPAGDEKAKSKRKKSEDYGFKLD